MFSLWSKVVGKWTIDDAEREIDSLFNPVWLKRSTCGIACWDGRKDGTSY
jgi:hypothetical protein